MDINSFNTTTIINQQSSFSRVVWDIDLLLLSVADMVATQKLYPRATVKRIVKAHANRNVSKNADILVSRFSCMLLNIGDRLLMPLAACQIFLDYILFMQE